MADDTFDLFPKPPVPDTALKRVGGEWRVYSKGVVVWSTPDMPGAQERALAYLEQLELWRK